MRGEQNKEDWTRNVTSIKKRETGSPEPGAEDRRTVQDSILLYI